MLPWGTNLPSTNQCCFFRTSVKISHSAFYWRRIPFVANRKFPGSKFKWKAEMPATFCVPRVYGNKYHTLRLIFFRLMIFRVLWQKGSRLTWTFAIYDTSRLFLCLCLMSLQVNCFISLCTNFNFSRTVFTLLLLWPLQKAHTSMTTSCGNYIYSSF